MLRINKIIFFMLFLSAFSFSGTTIASAQIIEATGKYTIGDGPNEKIYLLPKNVLEWKQLEWPLNKLVYREKVLVQSKINN